MRRRLILGCALLFALLLVGLTGFVLVTSGPDPLSIASLLVVVLVCIAVVGALREPPD